MNGATPETGPVPSGLGDPANATAENAALPLLQGRTTLAEALEEEENMLFRLAYPSQRFESFFGFYNTAKILKLSYRTIYH